MPRARAAPQNRSRMRRAHATLPLTPHQWTRFFRHASSPCLRSLALSRVLGVQPGDMAEASLTPYQKSLLQKIRSIEAEPIRVVPNASRRSAEQVRAGPQSGMVVRRPLIKGDMRPSCAHGRGPSSLSPLSSSRAPVHTSRCADAPLAPHRLRRRRRFTNG